MDLFCIKGIGVLSNVVAVTTGQHGIIIALHWCIGHGVYSYMHINMSWWYVKHDRLCYMGRMVCHGLFCDTAKEEFSILYFWVVCWQNIWTFCRWHKSNKKAQGCMKAYTSSSTSSFLAKILPSLVDMFVQLPHASYGRSKISHCSVHWSTRQNANPHFNIL